MLTISIDTTEVDDLFARLRQRLGDLSPAMRDIAEALHEDVCTHFDRQRGPDGPWPDLADATILARARRNKWPGKMLQVSGMLKNSLVPSHTASSARLTASTPYAALHHFGGMAGRGRTVSVPARPYMYLSPEGHDEVTDILLRHLKKAL